MSDSYCLTIISKSYNIANSWYQTWQSQYPSPSCIVDLNTVVKYKNTLSEYIHESYSSFWQLPKKWKHRQDSGSNKLMECGQSVISFTLSSLLREYSTAVRSHCDLQQSTKLLQRIGILFPDCTVLVSQTRAK